MRCRHAAVTVLRTLAPLLALAALGWLARPYVALLDHPDRARPGGTGPLAFVAVATPCLAVGMPRQGAAFAGGYLFGAWEGGALALLVQALGCLLDFGAARLARPEALRRRLRGLDGFLSAQPFLGTLTLRLLPVGNNLLLNLAAGLTAMPAGRFLLASLIGYVPQSAVFTLLGSGTRVGRGTQVALAILLFAVSAGLGAVLLRRSRRGRADVPP